MRIRLIAALLLLGGCASPEMAASPEPEIHSSWESCGDVAKTDEGTLPHLDDSFRPVAVVICRETDRERPGGGTERVAVEARGDDVSALLPALRLPDEPDTDPGTPCTADGQVVLWFALLDAEGRWMRPGIPVDRCHKFRTEFTTAYQNLATRTVSTTVVGQFTSDEAAASGCDQDRAYSPPCSGRAATG
ncbi:hypothetical protein [Actinoplanes sp. NBRC 101535]|uniref:hypothetical protein n=1 Tax=Actinoplanes sp. NBRC 101535 TaxID=3032196 RepID=UPI0024A068F2|nr:hypothetical protein [Actinoplanes sp. NBRC 101535]GLY07982.1 hypothetical protein Acsp01_83610 [Actinoplanes sp. NBRC 101535]